MAVIGFPSLDGKTKPKAGEIYRFWAYETLSAAGFPTEAFAKLEIPAFATTGLHFGSKLVVLKQLDAK